MGCGQMDVPEVPVFEDTTWVHRTEVRVEVDIPGEVQIGWLNPQPLADSILVEVRSFAKGTGWSDWMAIKELSGQTTRTVDEPTTGVRQYRLLWIKDNRLSDPVVSNPIDADCTEACEPIDAPIPPKDPLPNPSPRVRDPNVTSSIQAALTAEQDVLTGVDSSSSAIGTSLEGIEAEAREQETIPEQMSRLIDDLENILTDVGTVRSGIDSYLTASEYQAHQARSMDAQLTLLEQSFARHRNHANALKSSVRSAVHTHSAMNLTRDQNRALTVDLSRQRTRLVTLGDTIEGADLAGSLTEDQRGDALFQHSPTTSS